MTAASAGFGIITKYGVRNCRARRTMAPIKIFKKKHARFLKDAIIIG
jgi:hypothetical protein